MKLSYRLVILACIAPAIATAACATSQPAGNTNKNSSANINASQSKPADSPPAKTSQPGTGSIEVSSTPSGARVLLVAVDEGGAGEPQVRGLTPTTITAVYPGKYTVDLEKPGYRFFQKNVVVKAESTAKVNAVLRKQ